MNNDIHLMNDIIDTADWGVHDGWHITAKMVYDPDGHHWRDSELDDDGLQALEAGDWCYVGVIATARQGDHTGSDSIWGSQYGDFPGGIRCNPLTDQDYMYRADLIDNAVADGKMAASQGVTAVQRWDIYDIADSLADIPGMLTQCGADKLPGVRTRVMSLLHDLESKLWAAAHVGGSVGPYPNYERTPTP